MPKQKVYLKISIILSRNNKQLTIKCCF